MPIIYTYPSVTPVAEDLLLISDVSETNPTKATRKCTVGSLVALVGALVPGGGTVIDVKLDFNPVAGTDTGLRLWDGAAWQDDHTITTSGTFDVGGILRVGSGGTGLSTYLDGDILYYDSGASTTQLQTLTAGTLNHVLTSGGPGVAPSWSATAATGVTTFQVDVSALTGLPGLTPSVATPGVVTLAGLLGVEGGGTGVRTLTGVVKGNGAAAFTAGNVDLTSEVTGILPVANGGTGAATLTDGGILLGSGTGAVTVTAQPLHGEVLIGSTGVDPVLNTLDAGAGITINNGAGTIEIVADAVVPYKITHNSLTLRGLTGGTLIPNIHQQGVYWRYGDYVFLQFYLEWDIAGTPPTGAVIIENLPGSGVSPVGTAVDQGSCLITVNTNWGVDSTRPAPTCGRVGVTGAKEIVLRSPDYSMGSAMVDTEWSYQTPDQVGWVLAGTAWWLEQVG